MRYSDEVLIENPQAYLFRIASNIVSAWRERCSVRLAHDDTWLEELQIDPSDEPRYEVEQASVSHHLWTVVGDLPPRQREILLLHVAEGLIYQQIADAR